MYYIIKGETKNMDELNVEIGTETGEIMKEIPVKVGEIGELKKVHPRMYEVGVILFNDDVKWGEDGKIEIPYTVKNAVIRAIEEAGFSITIQENGNVIVNAIKKQLQHDA